MANMKMSNKKITLSETEARVLAQWAQEGTAYGPRFDRTMKVAQSIHATDDIVIMEGEHSNKTLCGKWYRCTSISFFKRDPIMLSVTCRTCIKAVSARRLVLGRM